MNIKIFKTSEFLFLMSCFFNSSFVVFSKLLGQSFSPYELSFYRTMIIFLIAALAIFSIKKTLPSMKKFHPLFLFKAVLALLSMITWFITINHLPIAETIAVSFSTPILTSILAIIILKEKFTRNHFVAFFSGLIGMYIIVSPEFGKMDKYALIGIFSCFLLSMSFIIIKFLLKKHYEPIEINYFGNMVMVPMALVAAFNEISLDKNLYDISMVVAFGFCIFCADFFHNLSYKNGDVTTLMPIMFTTIILGSIYDYFIFDIVISTRIIIGAAIVIFGIMYANIRNHRKSAKIS